MGPRYSEGYVKGVHDHDAAALASTLFQIDGQIGNLRYPSRARGMARLFWHHLAHSSQASHWLARIKGIGAVMQLFPVTDGRDEYVARLAEEVRAFAEEQGLVSEAKLAHDAAGFLFDELTVLDGLSISQEAAQIAKLFLAQVERRNQAESLKRVKDAFGDDIVGRFQMVRHWVGSYIADHHERGETEFVDEVAAALLERDVAGLNQLHATTIREIEGLVGNHPRLEGARYRLDYYDFFERLTRFQQERVPAFERYTALKRKLLDQKKNELRLEEFKPRVLTSFVRNRLIDEVYLPLIGDNLAKQIGVVGEDKRTDLMGLLLLISPPGYGKTTLMEYIANRLGLTFMKINGPAIGHHVTSLDPQEAPNASAREEVEKLNLALEMGDNVMIYLDDIQHCNPELLQKFISLCDGSRRIEGVYRGVTRTYDLRAKGLCRNGRQPVHRVGVQIPDSRHARESSGHL